MARASLSPGFRFHPTDVELVMYYLKKKVLGKKIRVEVISELNIYKYFPWDLPDKSCLTSRDLEWYFFSPKERKYASGARANRATDGGYWKSTGKDRSVTYKEQTVGMIKTLVFHIGQAPKGERTDWVMHEYRIQCKELADAGVIQDTYVLCKVFKKSGPGPKNGAQYGAPFNEEEWDNDDEICAESLPIVSLPPPAKTGNNESVITSMFVPGSVSSGLSEPDTAKAASSASVLPSYAPDNDEDNINSLLGMFTEDVSLLRVQNDNDKVENLDNVESTEGLACLDSNEIYNELGDLGKCAELTGGGCNFSSHYTTGWDLSSMHPVNDLEYLELIDLENPLYPPENIGSGNFLVDNFCESSNYCNSLQQNGCTLDSLGAAQHIAALNHLPLLSEGYNGHGDHFDVFQKGNDNLGSANLVFTPTYSANVTPCEEEGASRTMQDQNQGKQQRKSHSRLQHLLESIPARPASAEEHLAPGNGAERFQETIICSANDGGSSFHVKAEVARTGGCTKDALSEKLEESPFMCCMSNLPRMGFGEKVVKHGCGIAVFFFLFVTISALFCVFLTVVFTELGRYACKFAVSHKFRILVSSDACQHYRVDKMTF